jgi:hypothetical protein
MDTGGGTEKATADSNGGQQWRTATADSNGGQQRRTATADTGAARERTELTGIDPSNQREGTILRTCRTRCASCISPDWWSTKSTDYWIEAARGLSTSSSFVNRPAPSLRISGKHMAALPDASDVNFFGTPGLPLRRAMSDFGPILRAAACAPKRTGSHATGYESSFA